MKVNYRTGIRRWLKGFLLKHVYGMITCREFDEFVLDYIDDELSERHRSIFELHLRLCPECRQYLVAYQRASEAGRAVFPPTDAPVPDDVPEDLIKAILKARSG